jgi:hypothetical protein
MSVATAQPATATRGRLPVPARDRRPALAALAILLVLLGALGSALVAYRSGSRVDVLVARHDIGPGQKVTAEDISVARVASDGAAVVESARLPSYVGSYATTRIPERSLINATMFRVSGVIPDGAQLVGMVLPATQRIGQSLAAGDVVRVYYVAGKGNERTGDMQPGQTVVQAARVTGAAAAGGGSGQLTVTALIRDQDAGTVAQLASAGQVAVAKLPDSARPPVDLQTR